MSSAARRWFALLAAAYVGAGRFDLDLRRDALGCDRAGCRARAERFSWAACAQAFRRQLVPIWG